MDHDRSADERRHAVADLLAWYVNGTLEDGERARVEAHLATCPDCREELDLWRAMAPEIAALDVAPVPHPASRRALLDRLDVVARASRSRGPSTWPRPLRWLLIGETAAVLALAATLASDGERPARYRALAASEASVGTPAGLRLRVVFDERATERDLRALLVPLGAKLVDGPSPLGVYTLELPGGEQPAAAIAALRAQPLLRFVEPVGSPRAGEP
jgi:anti-sigma factor RsiW